MRPGYLRVFYSLSVLASRFSVAGSVARGVHVASACSRQPHGGFVRHLLLATEAG
jgi:hypothetical protein